MTDDQIVARFIHVVTRLYGTHFFDWLGDDGNGIMGENADCTNRNYWAFEELEALRELNSRCALARLIPLLDDAKPVIRLEASTACLGMATEKSTAILQDHADMLIGYGAECRKSIAQSMHWRAGKAVIPGVF